MHQRHTHHTQNMHISRPSATLITLNALKWIRVFDTSCSFVSSSANTSWVVCCFVELPGAVPVIVYCLTRFERDSLLLEARKSSSRFYPSSSYYYSSSRYRFSAIVLQHPRRSWSKQDSARPCIVTGAISFLQIINKYVFKLRQCSGMCRFST
jgi:hypothetical protein